MDATDVQKLLDSLPYLLDGLADVELNEFNLGKVADPIPGSIMAINSWMHWYHLTVALGGKPMHTACTLCTRTSFIE